MNPDFLWTWAVVPCRKSMLHYEEQTQHALLCSVLSVAKYFPESRRRFIVCPKTFEFLQKKGWIDLWTSVEVKEFPAYMPGFQRYYAYPKVWSTRFVEGPTIILDVETIVRKHFELRCPNRVMGPVWAFRQNPKEEGAERELVEWFEGNTNYVRDFYPTKGNQYIGAWCYYVPSTKAAEYTSVKTCAHIDKLLGMLPMKYGSGPACYLEDGYISHCYEEVCGIDFSQGWEWYEYFYHSLGDKWDMKGELNFENEKQAGLSGIYRKYLVEPVKLSKSFL